MNFENIIYQLIHDRVVRLIPLGLDNIFIRIDPEAFEDHISTAQCVGAYPSLLG